MCETRQKKLSPFDIQRNAREGKLLSVESVLLCSRPEAFTDPSFWTAGWGANAKIRNLVQDIEAETLPQNDASAPQKEKKGSSSDRLMEIAGVLDGWKMDTSGVDDVEFIEDEDMKRTREARAAKRRR